MTQELEGLTLAGKYKLERLLGRGGMGAVYEGKNVEFGRRVAVKVLASDVREHPEVHARFRREARAASAIDSEHIVQVIDVGSEPDVGLFMVMELLTGEDLETRLRREGRLDPEQVKAIAKQILRGLARAHAANVVHRDLKPANIFLVAKEDGGIHVKIVDFGISRFNDAAVLPGQAKGTAITRLGNAIGTPQYMSPEQAQGLNSLDHRTDIWSLGSLLYECLAGEPPFPEADTYEQTIVRIVTMPARPLLAVAPWVPLALAAAVDMALRHRPDERHADCAAFMRAIDHDSTLERSTTLPLSVRASTPSLAPEAPLFGPFSSSSRGRTELVSVGPAIAHDLSYEEEPPIPVEGWRVAIKMGLVATALVLFVAFGVVLRSGENTSIPAPSATQVANAPPAAPLDASPASVPIEPAPAPPAVDSVPLRPAESAPRRQAVMRTGSPGDPGAKGLTGPPAARASTTPPAARTFGGAGVTDKY